MRCILTLKTPDRVDLRFQAIEPAQSGFDSRCTLILRLFCAAQRLFRDAAYFVE